MEFHVTATDGLFARCYI